MVPPSKTTPGRPSDMVNFQILEPNVVYVQSGCFFTPDVNQPGHLSLDLRSLTNDLQILSWRTVCIFIMPGDLLIAFTYCLV